MTTIRLPYPIPLSACFRNDRKRGRVKTKRYNTWRHAAGWELKAQRPEKHAGQVSVTIAVQDKYANADLDNTTKCLLDLLVDHQIIEDDKSKIVRALNLRWSSEVVGCEVTVQPLT